MPQGTNVGAIYGSMVLDNKGYKAELKKTEKITSDVARQLSKTSGVKVPTEQWKKLTSQMSALSTRAHETRLKLNNVAAGTPEAKKLGTELKNLEAKIRNLKKITDPTTKSLQQMANANKRAADAAAGGGASAPGGASQFGGALASQAAGRMGGLGSILTTGMSAGPYVAAATAAVAAIAGIGLAAKKTTDSIKSMAAETAAWSEAVMDMSTNTGISTDMLQKLQHVSAMSGLSYEGITRGIAILIRRMPEAVAGTGDVARALQKLGISATTSSGQLRSMDDLVPEIIAKLQRMQNTTERNATAAALFGRGWMELGPILGMTADKFAGAMNQATALGLVLSDQELANVQAYDDALDELNQTLAGVKKQIGAAFAPYLKTAIEPLVEALPRAVEKLKAWLDSIKPTLAALADGFRRAWVAAKPMISQAAGDMLKFVADQLKIAAAVIAKIADWMPKIARFLAATVRWSTPLLAALETARRLAGFAAPRISLPDVEVPDVDVAPDRTLVGLEDAGDALDRQASLAADAASEIAGLKKQIALAGDSSVFAAMKYEVLNGKYREASDETKKLLLQTAKLKDETDAAIKKQAEHARMMTTMFGKLIDNTRAAFNQFRAALAERLSAMKSFSADVIATVKGEIESEQKLREEQLNKARSHYEKLSQLGRAGALARTDISMFGGKPEAKAGAADYTASRIAAAAAAVSAQRAEANRIQRTVESQLYGGQAAKLEGMLRAAEPNWEAMKESLADNNSLLGQLLNFAQVWPLVLSELRRANNPVESGIGIY